jgi:hypothetical protein
MNVLIQKYFDILTNECEIFLNFVVHFMDPERPLWKRIAALEVCIITLVVCSLCEIIHSLVLRPPLLECLCRSSDMKNGTAKAFFDIVCECLC